MLCYGPRTTGAAVAAASTGRSRQQHTISQEKICWHKGASLSSEAAPCPHHLTSSMRLHPANCDNAKPCTLAFSCSNLCIFPSCSCQKSLFHQHKCALHQHLFFQLPKQQQRPAHLPLKAGLPSFSWLNTSGFSQLISHTSENMQAWNSKILKMLWKKL